MASDDDILDIQASSAREDAFCSQLGDVIISEGNGGIFKMREVFPSMEERLAVLEARVAALEQVTGPVVVKMDPDFGETVRDCVARGMHLAVKAAAGLKANR